MNFHYNASNFHCLGLSLKECSYKYIYICMYMYLQRVSRPRGGMNEWFHWIPVSLHKKVERFFERFRISEKRTRVVPFSVGKNGINFNHCSN